MDELTFPRPDDLSDDEWSALVGEVEAYADLRHRQVVEARTFAPHVVAHEPIEFDDPDPANLALPAKDRRKTKRDAVTECPDCTRGLVADGNLLVCIDLRRNRAAYADLTGTFHDIIACGRTG